MPDNVSVKDTLIYKEQEYRITWTRTNSVDGYSPITQVYGVPFSKDGKILIARSSKKSQWQICGGHPEGNESIEETLQREMLEEVDTEIEDIKVIGVQKVEVVGNPHATHYQVRCVCKIKKILPLTPDPADKVTWERKLVSPEEVTKYVKWGKIGDDMFAAAKEAV